MLTTQWMHVISVMTGTQPCPSIRRIDWVTLRHLIHGWRMLSWSYDSSHDARIASKMYRPLLPDRRNRSQANFSRTRGVKMSRSFDFRSTIRAQNPTPCRSKNAYQNPELTRPVPDSDNTVQKFLRRRCASVLVHVLLR